MPASVITTAPTDRTALSTASARFSRTKARWRGALPPIKQDDLAEGFERAPTAQEDSLVKLLWNTLGPSLSVASSLKRPWPREDLQEEAQATNNQNADLFAAQVFALPVAAILTARIEKSVSDFVDKLPGLLNLTYLDTVLPSQVACFQSMDLRLRGETYKASCLLRTAIDSSDDVPTLLRLHYADSLSSLRLHDPELQRPAPRQPDTNLVEAVEIALTLFDEAETLFGDLITAPKFGFVSSAERVMLRASLEGSSLPVLFATICYCETLAACIRLACATQTPVEALHLEAKDQALMRLLQVWDHLRSDSPAEKREFLIWRCARALRSCAPFHQPLPGLSANGDALSLFIGEKGDSNGDHFAVLQFWRAGHAVHEHQLQLLVDGLTMIMERNDIAAVDDALHAFLLIQHTDLVSLQRRLLRLAWKQHIVMMPLAPWMLDSMLLHPLGLWVGVRGRQGPLSLPESPLPASATMARSHQDSEHPQLPYRHLQFGFGELGGHDEAAVQFLYSWAVLYQCLQYTPAPLDDTLYRLLFLDGDLFSWSQLCHRFQQVCRSRQCPPSSPQRVCLDGTSLEFGYLAGLGTTSPVSEGSERVAQLRQLTESLAQVRRSLQSVIDAVGDSPGVQHLRGLCLVWKGMTHMERSLEMSRRYRSEASSEVRDDLGSDASSAIACFQEACETGSELEWYAVKRLGAEGLLRLQNMTYGDYDDPRQQHVQAESLLQLCESIHQSVRAGIVQLYRTVPFQFLSQGGVLYTTAPEEPVTDLYHYAERSSSELGDTRRALAWVQRECEDVNHGNRRRLPHATSRHSRQLTSDAHLTLSTPQDPTVLAYLLSTALPPVGSLPGDIAQIAYSLPAQVGPCTFIMFGTGQRVIESKDTPVIKVYAVKSGGRGIEERTTSISIRTLNRRRPWRLKETKWGTESDQIMGDLRQVAEAISQMTMADELLVLIPGPLCRAVPLHALRHAGTTALWWRNPVVYAPDPTLFLAAVQRALTPASADVKRQHASVVAVYENYVPNELHTAAIALAPSLHGNVITGTQVTRAALRNAFTRHDWIFFLGHGNGGIGASETLHEPYLVLTRPQVFTESDMRSLTLLASHFELIACGSGQFRESGGVELPSLTHTLLFRGAASVVGTMRSAEVRSGLRVMKRMGARLAEAMDSHATVWNAARALQAAARTLQDQEGWIEGSWGPFYMEGSPVIAMTGRC